MSQDATIFSGIAIFQSHRCCTKASERGREMAGKEQEDQTQKVQAETVGKVKGYMREALSFFQGEEKPSRAVGSR